MEGTWPESRGVLPIKQFFDVVAKDDGAIGATNSPISTLYLAFYCIFMSQFLAEEAKPVMKLGDFLFVKI